MKVATVKEFSKRRKSDCLIIPFFGNKTPTIACEIKKIPEKWKSPIEMLDFSGKDKQSIFVYAKTEKELRVYHFEGELSPNDFPALFNRTCIRAIRKGIPSEKVVIDS